MPEWPEGCPSTLEGLSPFPQGETQGSGFRVQGSEPVVSGQWPVTSGQKQSESRFSSHQPLITSHLVSLGDKFALASGLMEITYDTEQGHSARPGDV